MGFAEPVPIGGWFLFAVQGLPIQLDHWPELRYNETSYPYC